MSSHSYEKIGPSASFIFFPQRIEACDPFPYLSSAPVHALLENVVLVLFPGWKHYSACPVFACKNQPYAPEPQRADVMVDVNLCKPFQKLLIKNYILYCHVYFGLKLC